MESGPETNVGIAGKEMSMTKKRGLIMMLSAGFAALVSGFLLYILRSLRLAPLETTPQLGTAPEKPQDFLLPETSEEINYQAPQLIPDDLTRLHGIGEKSAAVLAQVGIVTYAQLAKVSAQDIKTLLVESGNRITNPDNWPQQAGFAARGDWEGLANFLAQNTAA